MQTYETQTFTLPELDGISKKTMDEHIGLYQGYVKNFNAITALLWDLLKDEEKNMHAIAELERRRSFEFGGMRLHELYFPQFEGSSQPLNEQGSFAQALAQTYGSIDMAMHGIKQVAMMRGPGWSIL